MEKKNPFSVAERRWLVRELDAGRISQTEALSLINEREENASLRRLQYWRTLYRSDILLTLPVMTEKEKQKLQAAQKRMKELEKQLEQSQMKNIALEAMIDIAEQELKINIRKKSGPKQ